MKKSSIISTKKLTLNSETLRQISGREPIDSGGVILIKSDLDSLCGCPTQPPAQ